MRIFHRHKSLLLFLPLLLAGLDSCSMLQGEDQFTNKVVAPNFVAELYGNVNQSVTINHDTESHITWMGLVESNDYKYFKITKVQLGGQTVVSDGVDIGGETYVANPNAIVEDLTVAASESASNEYVNGSINVAGSGALKVTVKYSPLKAIETEGEPHEAYLIIYYDKPSVGAMRIKLNGFTQGVKNEKCARDFSTMTPYVYSFKGNEFDFYFCGSEVASKGQNNIASLPATDPGYHGQNTNLTPIPTDGKFLTFYQVDEETVCLLSADLTGGEPSIPDFTFVIPEGLAPIDSLDIGMSGGSFAECALDEAGGIHCDESILIETGVVPVSPLTATNGAFTNDELTTTQCNDFGALSGAGLFGDDEFTLILKGTMLSDANTQAYNIVDALVTGYIQLQCESGC